MATDSNFLGLGVVFKGIDEGFTKIVDKVISRASTAQSSISGLQKTIDRMASSKAPKIGVEQIQKPSGLNSLADVSDTAPKPVEGKKQLKQFDGMDKSNVSLSNIGKDSDKVGEKLSEIADKSNVIFVNFGKGSEKLGAKLDGVEDKTQSLSQNFAGLKQILETVKTQTGNTGEQAQSLGVNFESLGVIKDALMENFAKFDDQLKRTGKGFDDTEQKSSRLKKSFRSLSRFMSPFNIVTNLEEVSGWLKTLARGTELDKMTLQFDDMFQRMSMVFDPTQLAEFKSVSLSGMKLGVSADEANTLAKGMAQFGLSAKEATQVLPTMHEMVGVLGMDADHVAQMFGVAMGKLQQGPQEVIGLTKQFAKMGRAFGFIDPLESMPEIIKATVDSTFVLGKSIRQQAPAMALSIQKVAGGFTALGMTQKEATSAAVDFSNKNMDMLEQLERMSVGMTFNDDVFTKFAATMVKVGAAGSEMEAITKFQEIGGDQAKMLEYLQQAYKAAEASGTGMAKMFRFEMKDLFGKDVAQAITTQADSVKGTIKVAEGQAKALGDSDKAWKQQQAVMQNSLLVSEKITKSMEELTKVISELSQKEIRLEVNKDYQKALGDLIDKINQGDNALLNFAATAKAGGLQGFLEKMGIDSDVLPQLAALGFLFNSLLIPAFGVFTKIIRPISGFLVGIFDSLLHGASGFKEIGAVVKPLGKTFSKLLGPLGMIISFIDDIPKAIASFKAGNISEGITTILFGKAEPGEGLENIFNQMFKFSGIGFMLGGPIGAGIGAAVGGIVAFIKDGLERGFGTVWDEVVGGTGEFFGKVWAKIKEIPWGTIGSAIVDGIKFVFLDLPTSIGKWLGDMIPAAVGFIAGFMSDIISRGWNTAISGLKLPFEMLGAAIDSVFSSLFPEKSAAIKGFFSDIINVLQGYWTGFKNFLLDSIMALAKQLEGIPIIGTLVKSAEKFITGFQAGQKVISTTGEAIEKTADVFSKGFEKGMEPAKGIERSVIQPSVTEKMMPESSLPIKPVPEWANFGMTDRQLLTPSPVVEPIQKPTALKPAQEQLEVPKPALGNRPLVTTKDTGLAELSDAIYAVGDALLKQLKSMGDNDVNVTIEGDMKKFMRVVNGKAQAAMAGTLAVPSLG